MKAQEYLDSHFSKKERESIKSLDISGKELTGCLDLSDFVNLEELRCHSNQIESLELVENSKLEVVKICKNKIDADVGIFSHLVNLKHLDLSSPFGENNNFFGSLVSLKDCKNLEQLCIRWQPNIKEGLEYLSTDKLENFSCQGTTFKDQLRPFDYDVKAWKLCNLELMRKVGDESYVNHRLRCRSIEEILEQTEEILAGLKVKNLAIDKGRIERLENKAKSLKENKLELETNITKQSFQIYNEVNKSDLEKENQELRLRVEELERKLQMSLANQLLQERIRELEQQTASLQIQEVVAQRHMLSVANVTPPQQNVTFNLNNVTPQLFPTDWNFQGLPIYKYGNEFFVFNNNSQWSQVVWVGDQCGNGYWQYQQQSQQAYIEHMGNN